MEKKFVTLETFKEYDKKLKEYIDMRDGLESDEEDTCHMTSDECEDCSDKE